MNNPYDNKTFFEAYAQMPRSQQGLEAAGEWHQLQPLIPPLAGKRVLDLGCGYGWHCSYAAQQGAAEVLGLDVSEKMIARARAEHAAPCIRYQVCAMEEYDYPPDYYDLVVSNLALHYIPDLESIYRRVYTTLKPGGVFLFNIEHPVFTAGVNQDWLFDSEGKPLCWPIDHYFTPGPRETHFLGQTITKQHHTLTQILQPLLAQGFTLRHIEEAMPPQTMLHLPGMADEMRRPMMLIVCADARPRNG